MAIYLGETIRVKAQAKDPETQEVISDEPVSGKITFWDPTGTDPAKDPSRRATPTIAEQAMSWDATLVAYVFYVTTSGAPWDDQAGKWFYRVKITGSNYETWEYGKTPKLVA